MFQIFLIFVQMLTLTSGHFFSRHCYAECSRRYMTKESKWTGRCLFDFDQAWDYYNEIGHGVRISQMRLYKYQSTETESMGKFQLSCELAMERLERNCQEVCTATAEDEDLSCGLEEFEEVHIFRLADSTTRLVYGLRFPCRAIALRRPFKSILLGDAHSFTEDESALIENGDTVLSYQTNHNPDPEMQPTLHGDQPDEELEVRKIDYNEIKPFEEEYPGY